MEIKQKRLKGVFEIILSPNIDNRGFFMRTYDEVVFRENGIENIWVQENHSMSEELGIIRGLHLQLPPFAETKLVRCIKGAILDFFLDLRKESETFGQWESVEITAKNKKMVLVPRGFAHGFCTLTHKSEVIYKVDNFYNKDSEIGLIWNDPELGIKWPTKNPILSDKDKANISFREFVERYQAVEL